MKMTTQPPRRESAGVSVFDLFADVGSSSARGGVDPLVGNESGGALLDPRINVGEIASEGTSGGLYKGMHRTRRRKLLLRLNAE